MVRIFTVLALVNSVALLSAFTVGLVSFVSHQPGVPSDGALRQYHIYLGLFSAICTLLVHCLIFTYLLGTGRWVKEVGIAYQLNDAHLPKLTRELKRWTFPPALIAMLVTIATSATGAGVQMQEWPWYFHFSMGVVTLLVNLWAFVIEFRNVRVNSRVLDEVMVEVDRIRAAKGLPSNADALKQDGM